MGEQSFRNDGKNWVMVSRFTEAAKPEDRFLYDLEQYFATNAIEFLRLEYERTYRTIVLSLADLVVSFKQNVSGLDLLGISELPEEISDQLVFHTTNVNHSILSNLFGNQIFQPQQKMNHLWIGVNQSPKTTRPLDHLYQSYGIVKSAGTIKIRQSTGLQMVFELFKFPLANDPLKKSLSMGAMRKVPETGDNLRRREEWFRRRFGHKE